MVELSCYKFIGVFISKQPEDVENLKLKITQSVFCRSID